MGAVQWTLLVFALLRVMVLSSLRSAVAVAQVVAAAAAALAFFRPV